MLAHGLLIPLSWIAHTALYLNTVSKGMWVYYSVVRYPMCRLPFFSNRFR